MDLHSGFRFACSFVWGSPRLLLSLCSWIKGSQALGWAFCLNQQYLPVCTHSQGKALEMGHSRAPWREHAHHRRPGHSISHFTHRLWWPAQLLIGWGLEEFLACLDMPLGFSIEWCKMSRHGIAKTFRRAKHYNFSSPATLASGFNSHWF